VVLKISVLLICLGAILFWLKPAVNLKKDGIKSVLMGNIGTLNSALLVGNNFSNYGLDLKDFLTVPYTNPWEDRGGRQYFWNYLLKSSMFGEFAFGKSIMQNQAILMNWIIYLLLPLKNQKQKAIMLVAPSLLLFFAALIFSRYAYPFSASNDFRYIFPVVIFVSTCIAYALYNLSKTDEKGVWASLAGEFVVCCFIIASILFYTSFILSTI